MSAGTSTGPPRHPLAFWAAIVVAALLLAGGVVVAALGYAVTSGPDGVVRGYFAALERGDAADALAFGDLPVGPRSLLTSTVLAQQRRIAPLGHVSVHAVQRIGSRARVTVSYALAFPAAEQLIDDSVSVHEVDGRWRLVRTAVLTRLMLTKASQRATILGAAIPAGAVLLFPGAVPISFDSAYLRLDAVGASVDFSSDPMTQVVPAVSAAGKNAAVAAVSLALRNCLTGASHDTRCPLPGPRFVPDSLRGAILGALGDALHVDIANADTGALDISGTVRVSGRFRRLTFDNRVVAGHGVISMAIRASSYAVAALHITWERQP